MLDRCSEQKPAAKELPEYLKQRLRARGILGDNSCTAELVSILSYINIIFFSDIFLRGSEDDNLFPRFHPQLCATNFICGLKYKIFYLLRLFCCNFNF